MHIEPQGARQATQMAQMGLHWPSLLLAIALMLVGSFAPVALADAQGHANHGLAFLYFWSMSAGFVRGVGFVPHAWWWRWLFSAPACFLSFLTAAWLRWLA